MYVHYSKARLKTEPGAARRTRFPEDPSRDRVRDQTGQRVLAFCAVWANAVLSCRCRASRARFLMVTGMEQPEQFSQLVGDTARLYRVG